MDVKIIRWSIDVGWASTWVKIVNEWFAATIYCKYFNACVSSSNYLHTNFVKFFMIRGICFPLQYMVA